MCADIAIAVLMIIIHAVRVSDQDFPSIPCAWAVFIILIMHVITKDNQHNNYEKNRGKSGKILVGSAQVEDKSSLNGISG